MEYEDIKQEIYNKLELDDNDFLIYDKIKNLLVNNYDKAFVNDKNFIKLVKQLSYDFLVKKRREYKREDLIEGKYQCENPANFPEENSPLDKVNLIDHITSWTEEREYIYCSDISFRYLKNLDANILILLKDGTGKEEYQKVELHKPYPKEISNYINKLNDKNPYSFEQKEAYEDIQRWRYGFSPKGVNTTNNIRNACHKYLKEKISSTNSGEIIPIENPNIFFTNSFIFLSASEMTPSNVPDKLFEKSVKEFIIPLIEIIKPKAVIQGGLEPLVYTHKSINDIIEENDLLKKLNQNNTEIRKKVFSTLTQRLNFVHSSLQNKNDVSQVLFHINWDNENTTLFFPSYHPKTLKYYYLKDGRDDGYYVWKYIKDYLKD